MPTSASERRELVHEIQACNGHSRGDSASTTGNYPPQEQQSKTGIWWDVAPSEEYFKEAFRVSKNQIIWGANYFPNMPPTRCFLVWRKLSISENFSMAMAEYAWTSFNSNAKVFEGAPQGTKKEPRFHPTQKSVALYKWILANYAKPTDRILDTHLGSGSSAIACHDFGCEMLGIEIDDIYYEKAKQRLIDHQQQLTLF
jgi:site-specific DNA-methyltransferase (adenine-specific)